MTPSTPAFRKSRYALVATAVGLLITLNGCKEKAALPPDVIATVGERQITLTDFKRYLDRNAGTDLAGIAPAASSALLDQFVEETLLAEYGVLKGIDVSAEKVAAAVRTDPGSTVIDKRDEMRRGGLLRDVSGRLATPSDEDVQRFYDQHVAEFNLPERVRARQILIRDEGAMRDATAALKSGAPFEQVAREYSAAPNADAGGDLGLVGRDQLPPIFEKEIFSLAPGRVSRVIKTDESYHIFKVEAVHPPGPVPIAAARPTILARLRQEAMDREMAGVLTEARSAISSKVLARRLPFPYTGTVARIEDE